MRRHTPPAVYLFAALCSLAGCDDDDDSDKKNDDNDGPSAWLVGDEGTMLRLETAGDLSGYPLDSDADLTGIACHGHATAWVSGADGSVLRTHDAGAHWTVVDIDVADDLRAVAVAEGTAEGEEAVWVVGDAGVAAVTFDGGASWQRVDADVGLTGVATGHDGRFALATADDGSIWRLSDAGAQELARGPAPLHGIAMDSHAQTVVAVGDGGTVLRSDDGAVAFTPVPLSTDADLFAVRVSADGTRIVAVGEAGTVVRLGSEGVEVDAVGAGASTLRGLHLRADGTGQAVGDGGAVWWTDDVGQSWAALDLPTTANLSAVDDFHLGGHL